jgi:hypothetical protein
MSGCDERMLQALQAVKNGDFSVRLPEDESGTAREIAVTFNVLMEQLTTFTGEVSRVSNEIGKIGLLGGQAVVPDLSGTWLETQNNVNALAYVITEKVRRMSLIADLKVNGGKTTAPFTHDPANPFNEIRHLENNIATLARRDSAEM